MPAQEGEGNWSGSSLYQLHTVIEEILPQIAMLDCLNPASAISNVKLIIP